MKTNHKSTNLATIAIFFASMLVIHVLTSIIFNVLPTPIKPTIIHIPVIVASIIYGPKIGASLGALMGMVSIVHNTIFQLPTSYLFSPLVENGNLNSLIIALVPRILIGVLPYFVYRLIKNRVGLVLAGAVGSATNTIFVLGGIFFLFSETYKGDVQALLAVVLGTNSIVELLISALLTLAVVPPLLKLRK